MSAYNHNRLLEACRSNNATTEERERMSYAAGMWACGERKITRSDMLIAEEVLTRSSCADVCNSPHPQDYDAEYVEESQLDGYEGLLRITVTTGPNAGRSFAVKQTDDGYQRGFRTYQSLASAAGGFAPKL